MGSADMPGNTKNKGNLPLQRFLSDRRGNFAVITGLMALPLVVAMGGAVDYSNSLRIRSEVQAAADAAALAAAKYPGKDEAERERQADLFFAANMRSGTIATKTASEQNLTVVDNRFTYDVDFDVAMPFLSLVQMPTLAMNVQAVSADAGEPLDIVLVLDSSGSMDQQHRMTELKKAVTEFLANFEQSVGKVQVALIPFDTQVRVDKLKMPKRQVMSCNSFLEDLKSLCNLAVQNYSARAFEEGNYFKEMYEGTTYEVITKRDGNNLVTIASGSGKKNFPKMEVARQPYAVGPLNAAAVEEYSGCLKDRALPYDARSTAVSFARGDEKTQYLKDPCKENGLLPVHPLTDDLAALDTAVQRMQPSGNTNITIGIQWGMEAFTTNAPLTGAQQDEDVSKVMIVLTDGDNTANATWSRGPAHRDSLSDPNHGDNRTAIACANAKVDAKAEVDESDEDDVEVDAAARAEGMGIEIYTIRLSQGNEALLKQCATDADHYFAVKKASDLTITFQKIADRVKRIRIVS